MLFTVRCVTRPKMSYKSYVTRSLYPESTNSDVLNRHSHITIKYNRIRERKGNKIK